MWLLKGVIDLHRGQARRRISTPVSQLAAVLSVSLRHHPLPTPILAIRRNEHVLSSTDECTLHDRALCRVERRLFAEAELGRLHRRRVHILIIWSYRMTIPLLMAVVTVIGGLLLVMVSCDLHHCWLGLVDLGVDSVVGSCIVVLNLIGRW